MRKVLVTGGYGFLGTAVVKELEGSCPNLESLYTFRSSQYDLRCLEQVRALLQDHPADTVIHLAASVGGIGANLKYPATFFYENLVMGVHLIEEARKAGVKRFINIGTICSYPKFTPVPFEEQALWGGYPEETNAPYGVAKKALIVQLDAYRQQYNFRGSTLMVVNLYGPGDNFDLESSHVIPAMIRKFHEARERGDASVTLWGDGSPTREFLYVDDAARAIRLAAEQEIGSEPINIGTGKEISMKDLALQIQKIVHYEGDIIWDSTKPNGQPRRCLDVSRAKEVLGFTANISLPYGLEQTYEWFQTHQEEIYGERSAVPASATQII